MLQPDANHTINDQTKKKYTFKRKPGERIHHTRSALSDAAQITQILPEGAEKYDILRFFFFL